VEGAAGANVSFPIDPTAATAAGDGGPRAIPAVVATPGQVVEVASSMFVGAVVACDRRAVTLRDRRGRVRRFELHPGAFLVDDVPVTLVPPAPEVGSTAAAPAVVATPSGSIPAAQRAAGVARGSRLLVEGVHDAELIEAVWGDDLRDARVVVEVLHGADDLEAVVRALAPGPGRRVGILLDHLVPGTKEARLAASVRHPHVLVAGHPFVDVWAAVRPEKVGIPAWPQVPRDRPWKEGVAEALGVADVQDLWRRIRAAVTSWRDLDQALIAAVEQLIDFVTDGGTAVQLRHATAEDAAVLADLGARTFRDSFAADNQPHDMERYVAEAFTTAELSRQLADPAATFILAVDDDGDAAAYAKLRAGDPDPAVTGRRPVELARIYVDHAAIGEGIGTMLMQHCLDEAAAGGYDTVWLGVWERNERAIAFYRRFGFEVVGTHTFVLGTDEQQDLVMQRPTGG